MRGGVGSFYSPAGAAEVSIVRTRRVRLALRRAAVLALRAPLETA